MLSDQTGQTINTPHPQNRITMKVYKVTISNEAHNYTSTKYNNTLTGFTSEEAASKAAKEALRDAAGELMKWDAICYVETLNAWVLANNGNWLLVAKVEEVAETEPTTNTPATMNANETIANTPANLAKLHTLAVNNTPMFYIWLDAVDDAATTSVYLSEDAARADIVRLEADDKEAGIYEPDAYRIINAAPYFA